MKTRNHVVPGLKSLIRRRSPKSLADAAGQLDAAGGFEALENRILLGGDHPSFSRPLLPNLSGRNLTDLVSDNGEATIAGTIGTIGDDDLFRFRMPGNAGESDFVTVLADTTSTGSNLNTRIEVYDQMGRMLVGPDVVGREGFDNGLLSSGVAEDGWGGFIAQAGQTYFIRVLGEALTTGDYQLRLNTRTEELTVDLEPFTPEGDPNPNFGRGVINGTLGPVDGLAGPFQQDEIVFRLTVDPGDLDEEFIDRLRSLATANAKIALDPDTGLPINPVDTHLEIYDAQGNLLDSDRQGGRLTNAFSTWRSNPSMTFFIRVRSDELVPPPGGDPALDQTEGEFTLVVDVARQHMEIDTVTRLGPADAVGFLADGTDSKIWSFTAQGTGLTFITVIGLPIPPLADPAIHLYNAAGQEIAFSDDFSGLNPHLEVELVGGNTYFLVVESFDDDAGGLYGIFIEAHHTFNESQDVDDHVDTPPIDQTADERRRRFEDATPIRFAFENPFLYTDADGNPVRDHAWVMQGLGMGRIHESDDTDLFQFTAPLDMLSDYAGNNDDAGTSLFAGGRFDFADPSHSVPVDSGSLAIWDANDWWHVGRQGDAQGRPWGFVDNPDTPGTSTAEIYAMFAVTDNAIGNEDQPFLIVGGDFDLIVGYDPFGNPIILKNLAVWVFDPMAGRYVWATIGDADAPVRAFTMFDPGSFTVPVPGDGEDRMFEDPAPNMLIIGGDFTNIGGTVANRLASFSFTTGLQQVGDGIANGSVRALAVYDPEDPGEGREDHETLPDVRDPYDPPATLFIGGNFTKNVPLIPGEGPSASVSGLITWNGATYGPAAFGTPVTTSGGVTGGAQTVHSLQVYEAPDPDGDGPMEAPGPLLYVGGSFTSIYGVAAQNIARFGTVDPNQDPENNPYTPRLLWEGTGVGLATDGPVFAMTVFDPAEAPGEQEIPPLLIIGGSFSNIGSNIGSWIGTGFTNFLGLGFNAPVRALAAFSDQQEVATQSIEGVDDSRQVLYAGGEFTEIVRPFPLPPLPANGAAAFDIRLNESTGALFRDWRALSSENGVTGHTGQELPGGVANADGSPGAIFAFAAFDDHDPSIDNSETLWDRNDRPATRLRIEVNPTVDSFLDARVRVYDSNFNLIYENDFIFNPPPFDPAGSADPAIRPAVDPTRAPNTDGPEIWAGETYYIEVSSIDGGRGRYELSVITEAIPPFDVTDGVIPGVSSTIVEVIEEGRFDLAQFQQFILEVSTGDDTNRRDARDDFNLVAASDITFDFRTYDRTPQNTDLLHRNDLGTIHSIFDTDLYAFRAPGNGPNFVEIRLSTAGLFETFAEGIDDATTLNVLDEVATKEKFINSFFDGALRVFNNDLVELDYNDFNPAVGGEFDVGFVGSFTDRTFFHRDPRIVIPVMGGEIYYIQVESGQLRNIPRDEDGNFVTDENGNPILSFVDWRMAIGAYELMINAVPDFTFDGDDDHQNALFGDPSTNDAQLSTVIPINIEANSDQNGRGTASGVINHTPANPDDSDLFQMIMPHTGIMQVRVSAAAGSPLAPQIVVFDSNLNPVATATGVAGGQAVTVFGGDRGERFFITIAGAVGSEGAYNIVLQSVDVQFNPVTPAVFDDHVDYGSWLNATEIEINRFNGRGTADGTLEETADSDVFRFTATSYEIATVTVTSQSAGFRPAVVVFEVGEDPIGNPVFLQIGRNRGVATAETRFSTTPGLDYYIVVLGANIETDFGDYEVLVDVNVTDDHPNLAEFPVATLIPINYNAGTGFGDGAASGELEVETDSDLFRFVSPRTGQAFITVTTPDSPLAVRFRIIDASTGETLVLPDGSEAIAEGAGGMATFTLDEDVFVLGREFYLVIEPGTPGPGQPELTGAYSIAITTAPADDHADEGDLPNATVLTLDPNLGTASDEGLIFPQTDTDLFTFQTLASGRVRIHLTTPISTLAPAIRVLAADGFTVVAAATGDTNQVSVEFNATDANQRYYIVVLPDTSAVNQTGLYTLAVQGSTGMDDHANANEWGDATIVTLDTRKADGQAAGVVNFEGDTDLFRFTALDSGPARVQVVVPAGSTLNGSVRIFNAQHAQIAFNSQGLPGSTANLTFDAVAGQTYFVLVEPEGSSQGAYTLRLDTEPTVHYLYHPEGYTSDLISEFIPLVNPNNFDVNYTIIARYEVGERDQVIATGTIAANSRGGITINDRFDASKRLVRPDTPYAIEIQSDGPLGATLSHYDFGITTGENFTDTLSTTWTFAEVHRDPDAFRDFLVFYNPNDVTTVVHIKQVYENGAVNEFDFTLEAFRRGGVNFTTNDQVDLNGRFGLVVTASVPIVAAVTSFDIAANRGYGLLGQAGAGATEGVIPLLEADDDVESGLSIFNSGSTAAEVTIRAMYNRVDLPDIVRTVTVAANTTIRLTAQALGLTFGETAAITFSSDNPVTVNAFAFQNGDGDATAASTAAGTTFLFGDAFVNPAFAGITYIENLGVFNPTAANATITLTFLFTDGTTATSTVTVEAGDFSHISIDQQPAILNRVAPTAFSLRVDSSVPVLTSFMHYDLFLNGGWSAIGAPIGFTNSVATL